MKPMKRYKVIEGPRTFYSPPGRTASSHVHLTDARRAEKQHASDSRRKHHIRRG
jgi:hypothetical protein